MSAHLLKGLRHRFLSAALMSIPLIDACVSYASDGNSWRLLSALGWLAYASAWFLRPVVFSREMFSSMHQSEMLALLSRRQWGLLIGAGLVIATLALIGRYGTSG